MNVSEIIKKINENDWVIFVLAVVTFAGFIMTVYVVIKTKSISKILKIRKEKEKYNLCREEYAERFKGYIDSILKDNNYTDILINQILTDFYTLMNLKDMMNNKNIEIINKVIKRLENTNMKAEDFRKTAKNLAYFVSQFSEREELNV